MEKLAALVGDTDVPQIPAGSSSASHATTIFIFGFISVVLTVIALFYCRTLVEDPTRSMSAGAYGITFIGALNGSLMFIVVHDLDPAMTWNEATFWTSLARLVLALPVVAYEKYNEYFKNLASNPSEITPLLDVKKDDSEKKSSPDEWSKWVPSKEQWDSFWMLTVRCTMSVFSGNIAPYVGVQFLPLSDAAAISALTPFFAMIFSSLLLNEHLSWFTIALTGLAFVGVLFVLRPLDMIAWMWVGEDSPMYLTNQITACAALVTLAGAACGGLLGPIMRGWRWPVWDVVAYVGLVGVAISLLIDLFLSEFFFTGSAHFDAGATRVWSWAARAMAESPLSMAAWIFLLGVSSFNKTLCINWAWKLDHAGAIEIVYVSLLVGMQVIFQLFVFEEQSELFGYIGTAVICVSCGLIVYARMAEIG